MKQESLQEELKGLSPKLHDLKQQNDGMRVPEGYFDALEDSVLTRLDTMGTRRQTIAGSVKRNGIRAWLFRPQVIAALAALFVVVLTAKRFFAPTPAAVQPVVVHTQPSEEELIEAYILQNISDFEVDQLAAVAKDREAEVVAPPVTPLQTPGLEGLSPEAIELLLREMSDEELESIL
ncbi:MAG: hypothetical protein IPK76_20325 [Lewinellaceae bacterium]|jgi:hypothetical protein|nr:hypothetical protein [Lewinellaceae bacterium]